MSRFADKQRQWGVTLVEVLVAVAIVGISVVAITEYSSKLNLGLKIEDSKAAVDGLAENTRLALSNLDGIINSITRDGFAGNVELSNCVGPGKTCSTFATREGRQIGFYLWSAASNPERIAGPSPGAAIGYTSEGERCTPGTNKCLFGAVTYFWATCPRNAAGVPVDTCTDPTYLNFRFQIVPLSQAAKKSELTGSQPVQAFPRNEDFNSDRTSYVIRVKTTDIVQRLRSVCRNDTKQVGVETDGTPRCECHSPAFDGAGRKRYRPDGTPICAPQTCPSRNDIMVGFNPNGKIKCIDQNVCASPSPPPECPCHDVDLSQNGECNDGYWLVHIGWGNCYATWSKGKGYGYETVVCDEHRGRCCKLDIQ
jgi:prepilin-type N-terminal cleavage/methylation domain-containing protein